MSPAIYITARSAQFQSQTLASLVLLLGIISLQSCTRQFSVSVNEQTLYDPRTQLPVVQLSDPGLQGCVNIALQQQQVQSINELSALSCANSEVVRLDGLEQLHALRFLNLSDNNIDDLNPLQALGQLSGLSLANNPISDVAALLSLPSLNVVNLLGSEDIPCSQLNLLEQKIGTGLQRPANCRNN